MKNNISMDDQLEQKILFSKFSIKTLNSIKLLYEISKTNEPKSLIKAYDKKISKYKTQQKNHRTATKYKNFSLDEIIMKTKELSSMELYFITINIVIPAGEVIAKEDDELNNSLKDKIKEYFYVYASEIERRGKELVLNNMSQKEITAFFRKYNIAELEQFDTIFRNIKKENNLEDVKRIKEEVLSKKYREYFKTNKGSVYIEENIQLILNKKDALSNKEFEFLHSIIDIARKNLSRSNGKKEMKEEIATLLVELEGSENKTPSIDKIYQKKTITK